MKTCQKQISLIFYKPVKAFISLPVENVRHEVNQINTGNVTNKQWFVNQQIDQSFHYSVKWMIFQTRAEILLFVYFLYYFAANAKTCGVKHATA